MPMLTERQRYLLKSLDSQNVADQYFLCLTHHLQSTSVYYPILSAFDDIMIRISNKRKNLLGQNEKIGLRKK